MRGLMQQRKREIGGYLELERFGGREYHEGALALNCARNCLAYLIEARGIKTLWVPHFLCASVDGVAKRFGAAVLHYDIQEDFRPAYSTFDVADNEYLYLVDYYGQLPDDALEEARIHANGRLIVDEVMAFFRMPMPGADTIYSCRKFFGVADGAYLYTDARIARELEADKSHGRMGFVLGRCERPANEFYGEASANNEFFIDEDIKWMSPITRNILHGVDYQAVAARRTANFEVLAKQLDPFTELAPRPVDGAFMYPLLVENGAAIRKELQARKIYISTLWPYAVECTGISGRYARDILPMVVDQRYDADDMRYECAALKEVMATLQL